MDAKLREDLFRRYVASLDRRLEDEGGGGGKPGKGGVSPEGWGGGRHGDSEALLSTATALLGAYQPEPGQRFRMVRFYEVVEKALRCQRGGSLRGLERAFRTLETLTTNLLLFPWKKEFRCIKTFTGPYVYHLQSAVCDADLRSLLRSIGYARDHELQFHARDHPGGPAHLRQLAFELFLAQAECRLLREVVALARGAASETEALELRRGCRDDAAGCAEALRRRDSLGADMARLSVRPSTTPMAGAGDSDHRAPPHPHHPHLRRGGGGRPSKSVDVTDGAGHWHAAAAASNKPVLKASLSLRKEPLFVDAEDDAKDEILRPGSGGLGGLGGGGGLALTGAPLSVAAPPSLYSPSPSAVAVADFFPVQSPPPPAEAYSSYHLSSLDEIDLYTERGGGGGLGGGRQTPSSRPPSREPRDSWVLKPHGGGGGGGVKCQCCGLVCASALASPCQRCDTILCAACHDVDPSPCCGLLLLQDYPPSSSSSSSKPRPLDGYVPVKEKLSVYSNTHSVSAHHHPHPLTLTHSHTHPHPQMAEKPLMAAKLFPGKALVVAPTQSGVGVGIGIGGSRCGFCNKPGSSHTCVSCSKVSCDTCMLLYAKDVCTRKNPQHSFLPNHQLNYSKAGSVSHLVYR